MNTNVVRWSNKSKRPCKTACRKRAISNSLDNENKPGQAVLFLPGVTCEDIKLALENKTIFPQDFVIAVEKNKDRAKQIESKLVHVLDIKNFYIHIGQIETLNLPQVLKGNKLKYCFFDFCGELTPQIAAWFALIPTECLADFARLCFTFHYFRRSMEWRSVLATEISRYKYPSVANGIAWIKAKNNNIENPKNIDPLVDQSKELIPRLMELMLFKFSVCFFETIAYYDTSWMMYFDTIVRKLPKENVYRRDILRRCLNNVCLGLSDCPSIVTKFLNERKSHMGTRVSGRASKAVSAVSAKAVKAVSARSAKAVSAASTKNVSRNVGRAATPNDVFAKRSRAAKKSWQTRRRMARRGY